MLSILEIYEHYLNGTIYKALCCWTHPYLELLIYFLVLVLMNLTSIGQENTARVTPPLEIELGSSPTSVTMLSKIKLFIKYYTPCRNQTEHTQTGKICFTSTLIHFESSSAVYTSNRKIAITCYLIINKMPIL